jgi:lipid II:glycine glycyltransferase (peptidoglycan interpeptide bridge formation enzyme)
MSYQYATDPKQRRLFDSLVTHVIQSWEWGEFRKKLGLPVIRVLYSHNLKLDSAIQMTIHKIPFLPYSVGYLPKGPYPDKQLADILTKVAREQKCAFIKIEPNVVKGSGVKDQGIIDKRFRVSPKPLFTKHNFVLDISKSEEELLAGMHPKTRYNIRVAQKHGVEVEARTDTEAFEMYLKLYFDTTKRQGYFGHTEHYHRMVWETLQREGMAFIMVAFYTPEGSKERIPLTTWMLLAFQDTLYYPYGGSSMEYRNVMANNLVAWDAIKLGKKMGLKKFDMWGALGPEPDPNDPFIGFHNFKKGYGGELQEYIGTFDLVLNYPVYWLFNLIDKSTKFKATILKIIGK